MDSKNNIGHSADISFTAELPIPIYNGNNSMDFEKLASLYKNELLDSMPVSCNPDFPQNRTFLLIILLSAMSTPPFRKGIQTIFPD